MGRRFRIFGISLVFGILLSYMLLVQGRDSNYLSWTVNNQVLEKLKKLPLAINPKPDCLLDCHKIKQWDIDELLADGEVLLTESSPRETPKKYVVEYEEGNSPPFKLLFSIETDSVRLIALLEPTDHNSCNCN